MDALFLFSSAGAVLNRFFEVCITQLLGLHKINRAIDGSLGILFTIFISFVFMTIPPNFDFKIRGALAEGALVVTLLGKRANGNKVKEKKA
jgi:hypothetical protein